MVSSPTGVVPALELADVAVQVLRRHLVIRAHVAPLEHRPERLHAVDVDLIADPFANAVLDRVPIGEGRVRRGLVGVDNRFRGSVTLDEARQSRPVYALDHRRPYAARGPFLTPATAILSVPPRPVSCFRFAACMFLALPPTKVSSASTGPAIGASCVARSISRSRCARCHA